MNVSYYEKDNKAYITNENDEERVVDSVDNIEEILVTENNIEDLELELKYTNEQLKRIKKEKKTNNFLKILISLFDIFIIVSMFFSMSLEQKLVLLLSASAVNVLPRSIFYYTKTMLKKLNIELELTLEQLEKEKEKLELLKANSKNKEIQYSEVKEIAESELLENFYNKRYLIQNYIVNKEDHIKCYENNNMKLLTTWYDYDESDIEFIKLLIEEELKNSNCKNNIKGKTKKLGRK